jgi:hypothetical protein
MLKNKVIPIWVQDRLEWDDDRKLAFPKPGYFAQMRIEGEHCVGEYPDEWARRQIAADLDAGKDVPQWAMDYAFQLRNRCIAPHLPSKEVADRYRQLRQARIESVEAYKQAVLEVAHRRLGFDAQA